MRYMVHTIPRLAQEASGPTYSVHRLCEELCAQGASLKLLALEDGQPKSANFVSKFALGWGPKRLGPSISMSRWLHAEARANKVSLLHNHSLWMMPNVYPGRAARKYNIPFVVSPRGTFSAYSMTTGSRVKRLFWPLVQKPALKAVTCFHATSHAEYLDIRAMGFQQPVTIIPNGIDNRPSPAKQSNARRVLLYLGRLHPEKGIGALLKAWSKVHAQLPDWDLRIVGPGNDSYVQTLSEQAKTLQLPRCVFAGPAYGEDKFSEYQNCDAYILPSPSENFAMTVAEALMAARPVITTTGTPWKGLKDHKAGWWVDPKPDPLANAIFEAAQMPRDQLSEFGENGRAWVQEEFSWQKVGASMGATYDWLQGNGDQPDCIMMQ